MTRLSDIKDKLLEARKETQAELNQIDKALDAIGIQREVSEKPKQRRRQTNTRPVSQDKIDRIMRAIRASDRPVKRSDIAEAADMNPDVATKALSWLKQEKMIEEVGKAPGKGHSPLYAVTEKGANEMLQDIAPSPIHRIEDRARPEPVNQG